MILTIELDLKRIELNHCAKYPGQRSFHSKVTVRRQRRRHTRTHTHRSDCSTGPANWSIITMYTVQHISHLPRTYVRRQDN